MAPRGHPTESQRRVLERGPGLELAVGNRSE